jgi:hypothetical protein
MIYFAERVLKTTASVLITCVLTSCSLLGSQRFGIGAIYSGKFDIYRKELYDSNLHPFNSVDASPRSYYPNPHRPLFLTSTYFIDNGKQVPNSLRLQWSSAPYEGGGFSHEDQAKIAASPAHLGPRVMNKEEFKNPYPHPPRIYGPFDLKIREKIPSAILQKITGSNEFGLGITVEFTETSRKIYWALWDHRPRPPEKAIFDPICVGGELDALSNQKEFLWTNGILNSKAQLWPHCKL